MSIDTTAVDNLPETYWELACLNIGDDEHGEWRFKEEPHIAPFFFQQDPTVLKVHGKEHPSGRPLTVYLNTTHLVYWYISEERRLQ